MHVICTCVFAHLLVVLLQVDQLLLESFDLHLQVRAGHGELVKDAAQPGDVSLHRLAQRQLVLIPTIKLHSLYE